MIYTLTLNPAVDRELVVERIDLDTVLRANASRVDAGGKGFNVSRQLRGMGTGSVAVGWVAGEAGRFLEASLTALGIKTDFVWLEGETRTNVSVVAAQNGQYLKVNEAGPTVSIEAVKELLLKVEGLAKAGDWWVLAGSLPPGVPADIYARITRILEHRQARVVVDASGPALQLACQVGPFLVKPNQDEARQLTGLDPQDLMGWARCARLICRIGPQRVIISLGKGGALLYTTEGAWHAASPEVEQRNPVGAGDALVGGIVWALGEGLCIADALGWGVACGAAAASSAGTGVGSRAFIESLHQRVSVTRLNLG